MLKIKKKGFAVAMLAFVSLMGQTSLSVQTGMAWANSVDNNQHQSIIKIRHGEKKSRSVKIALNKATIIELPTKVSDVLVSNPKLLDAVVHTSKRVYLIGMKPGQVNVFFFDKSGAQISTLEVSIERDVAKIEATLNRLIPGSNIHVETLGYNVILSGSVRTPADSNRATNITKRMFGGSSSGFFRSSGSKEKVMNMLAVQSKEQVMLKVVIAEMNRKVAKELGIEINSVISSGNALAGLVNAGSLIGGSWPSEAVLPFTTRGINAGFGSGNNRITSTIKALEENGVIKTLAEPNLTALSGETAKFHAGGEFPFQTGYDRDKGTYTYEWKKYGVQLNFTPVVMSEGRISLKIKSNVSEIDSISQIGTVSLPTISQRETDTTVELPSGGTMVIGGLISEKTRQNIDGLPGLKDMPVLGALFSSKKFVKEETELVVIVTPYMVKPIARNKVRYPGQGFSAASDAKRNLLGRANRVYGGRKEEVRDDSMKGCCGKPPVGRRQNILSATGFIVD